MKRLISVFLLLSLLLCACGGKSEETTAATTETVPVTTAAPTTQAPVTETTAPRKTYQHPLTGEELEEPFTGRPLTITINNLVDALPQHGIADADILYEVETEGGITRCLAVITDLKEIEKLGPVRSVRTYFNSIALSYDAVIAHCGGSSYATIPSYDATGTRIQNWQHIDAMDSSAAFYRDRDRLNSGFAYEHTMFTDGQKLLDAVRKAGYPMEYDTTPVYGLQFDEKASVKGNAANQVEIQFRGTKKTAMTYDEARGLYTAAEYGKDWIDANTGDPLAFRNLLILQTRQFNPDNYHSMYDLQGSGDGYLAMGGKIAPIKWSRDDVNQSFRYTFEDGTPITLGTGKTYAAVIATSGKVTNS